MTLLTLINRVVGSPVSIPINDRLVRLVEQVDRCHLDAGPRSLTCRAICMMQPTLPVTTISASVASMRSSLRLPSLSDISVCVRL